MKKIKPKTKYFFDPVSFGLWRVKDNKVSRFVYGGHFTSIFTAREVRKLFKKVSEQEFVLLKDDLQ